MVLTEVPNLAVVPSAPSCPVGWCAERSPGHTEHTAEPVSVLATAGRYRTDLFGAAVPRMVAAAYIGDGGSRSVVLTVLDPTRDEDQALEVAATPDEAQRYAEAILAQVRRARLSEYTVPGEGVRLMGASS